MFHHKDVPRTAIIHYYDMKHNVWTFTIVDRIQPSIKINGPNVCSRKGKPTSAFRQQNGINPASIFVLSQYSTTNPNEQPPYITASALRALSVIFVLVRGWYLLIDGIHYNVALFMTFADYCQDAQGFKNSFGKFNGPTFSAGTNRKGDSCLRTFWNEFWNKCSQGQVSRPDLPCCHRKVFEEKQEKAQQGWQWRSRTGCSSITHFGSCW